MATWRQILEIEFSTSLCVHLSDLTSFFFAARIWLQYKVVCAIIESCTKCQVERNQLVHIDVWLNVCSHDLPELTAFKNKMHVKVNEFEIDMHSI